MNSAFLRLIFQALIVVCITGCVSDMPDFDPYNGKPHRVVFTIDPLPANGGGLLLWGKNSNGDSFGRVVTGNTTTVDLNSGNWTYYGMAWTGENGSDSNGNLTTNDQVAGVISCAVETKTLTGDGKSFHTISSFNTANCNRPEFVQDPTLLTGTSADYRLGFVRLNFCESVANITGGSDQCSDNLDSVAEPNRKEAKGHAMSFRISLVSYDKDKNGHNFLGQKLSSGCISASNLPATALRGEVSYNLEQIPTGDGSTTPFYLQLEAFPGDPNCSGSTHGSRTVNFPNGIVQNSSTVKHFTSGFDNRVYVKMSSSEICTAPSLAQTFAGGDGTKSLPKLICSVNQFYNMIGANKTYSYKLLANIDLSGRYKGITDSLIPSIPGRSCIADGANFIPVEMNTSTCVTSTSFAGSGQTGDFDGGGKTITGLRIYDPSATNSGTGLFGLKVGGEIRRLTGNNWNIQGRDEVGTIAGNLKFTAVKVLQVTMNDPVVHATYNKAGGIAGRTDNSTSITDVFVNRARVRVDAYGAGGVAGIMYNTNVTRTFVSGTISATPGANAIGGLAGEAGGVVISKSRFEGFVSGSLYVGGLVGLISNNTTFTSTYVHGGVQCQADVINDGYCFGGGFVGIINAGTVNFSEGFFFGRLNHKRSVYMGMIVGNVNGAHTSTNVYYATEARGPENALYGTPAASALFTAAVGPALTGFDYRSGDIPRLNEEVAYHPCRNGASDSVALQSSTRGTSASNPILICSNDQLAEIRSAAYTNKFYKLVSSFYNYANYTPTAFNFSGQLDGDGNGIAGLKVSGGAGTNISWWNEITGTIKNISFWNPIISDTASANKVALLGQNNYGTLDKVAVQGIMGDFTTGTHGGVVHGNKSSGLIRNFKLTGAFWAGTAAPVVAGNNFGGVAYQNDGLIEKGQIEGLTINSLADSTTLAGVVAQNSGSGKLRKIRVDAEIIHAVNTYNNLGKFGLVFVDNSGVIEDIGISDKSEIFSHYKYGLHQVGISNLGTVRRIYGRGSVRVRTPDLPSPLVPGNPAEFEAGVSPTISVNPGSIEKIYYTKEPRWHTFAYRVISGLNVATCVAQVSTRFQDTYLLWWTEIQSTASSFSLMRDDVAFTLRSIVTTATLDATTEEYTLATCLAADNGSNVYLNYNFPYDSSNGTAKTSTQVADFAATWSDWDNDPDSDGSTISVNNLSSTGKSVYFLQLQDQLGVQDQPEWIFSTSGGMRLFIAEPWSL